MPNTRKCFVIMPFRPELNYFYLYFREFLKNTLSVECERADHKILTIPLLEKIRAQILESDVILADISGRNPNVFYELGLADAHAKKVILITQDTSAEIPTDIRHLEFIKYDLAQHVEFLDKLKNALNHVFVGRYARLYEKAKDVLKNFNLDLGLSCEPCFLEDFHARVAQAERTQDIPDESSANLLGFLLPKIIKENSDIAIIQKISDWVSQRSARQE